MKLGINSIQDFYYLISFKGIINLSYFQQILEHQYSYVSFPSLHKTEKTSFVLLKSEKKPNICDKPLIKVTVIPKTDKVQAAKFLRRRRYLPKSVHSTTSNHENSIQTKNVYLIVAGRRKEKIYEIKTTGSAKLSSDYDSYAKDEEIPISELTNFKRLIQSLNMDRKKKKKETKAASEAAESSAELPSCGMEMNCIPNCDMCMNEKDSTKKSHVRIYGQFGVSKDDKYVLRYGATVDDKQGTNLCQKIIASQCCAFSKPYEMAKYKSKSSLQS